MLSVVLQSAHTYNVLRVYVYNILKANLETSVCASYNYSPYSAPAGMGVHVAGDEAASYPQT